MIGYIPFDPSNNNYALGVPIDGERYNFITTWNARDDGDRGAWYFDLIAEDGTVMARSIKVVLGVNLCRRSAHPFFRDHILFAYDTLRTGRDAGFDELGKRVVVICMNADDVIALQAAGIIRTAP